MLQEVYNILDHRNHLLPQSIRYLVLIWCRASWWLVEVEFRHSIDSFVVSKWGKHSAWDSELGQTPCVHPAECGSKLKVSRLHITALRNSNLTSVHIKLTDSDKPKSEILIQRSTYLQGHPFEPLIIQLFSEFVELSPAKLRKRLQNYKRQ